MNSQEFIVSIAKLKPSLKELSRPDYDNELVNIWLNYFEISTIKLTQAIDDPIVNLIKCNDISLLDVNGITFDPNLNEHEEYIFFGWDSNDRLAIQKSNKKIVSYDSYSCRIMFECADNSSRFLDALVEIMKFFREKILANYEEEERDKRGAKVAYICALKAGGEQYEDYYKSILWIE
ncbi:MAG: hypothetical protein ACQUHE_14305 [Bacteroidia bacterium]